MVWSQFDHELSRLQGNQRRANKDEYPGLQRKCKGSITYFNRRWQCHEKDARCVEGHGQS